MSTGRWSGARLDRTHEAMAGHVERGEVPGLVTLVARRGEVRADAVGAKAVGSDPMRRDTIFRISSLTKPIAAAAAMVLVEDGRLRLDEPVDRLLPELVDRRVQAARWAARRHRAREEADHVARPADPAHGLRLRLGAAGRVPDLDRRGRAAAGHGAAEAGHTARAGRVDPPFRDAAAYAPAGRTVDVRDGVRRAWRADLARLGEAARILPPRAHLRSARHGGHRLPRARRKARPAGEPVRGFRNRGARAIRRRWRQPVEPSARVPGRQRRAGLDRRRLPRIRPDD